MSISPEDRERRALAKARKPWHDVINECQSFATARGLKCEVRDPRSPQYQICRLTGDGVRLVVYPHRAPGMHYVARARDENSRDKDAAKRMLIEMGFYVKHKLHWFMYQEERQSTP